MNSNLGKKYSEAYTAWKAIIGQNWIDWTGFESADQAEEFLRDRHNITATGTQLKSFRQAFKAYNDAVARQHLGRY